MPPIEVLLQLKAIEQLVEEGRAPYTMPARLSDDDAVVIVPPPGTGPGATYSLTPGGSFAFTSPDGVPLGQAQVFDATATQAQRVERLVFIAETDPARSG